MVPVLPKYNIGLLSASTTNGATTATALTDTKGHDYFRVSVYLGTSSGSTVSSNPSVLKLLHSDTSNFTDATDITGFIGDTDFVIPLQYTSTSNITKPFAVIGCNLNGKKRYIGVQVVPSTTVVVGPIITELYRSNELPVSAANVNADVVFTG
jgi:hypothetical protein